MRFTISTAVVAIAVWPCAVLAQPDEIAFGPAPDWAQPSEKRPVPDDADGMLYLRANNYVAHIHSGGQQSYFDQTVRILTSQALQAGNIALRWNPAAGKPVIHALQITRDGAVIDVLKSTEFQILRREEQLETAMLDGLLTATLKVPDLRVGDDLTLAYSLPASDPTLRDVSYGLLYILDVPPPGAVRLALNWEDGHAPAIKIAPALQASVMQDANSVAVEFVDPPILRVPEGAPARYGWTRVIEYSQFADWPQMSRRFHGLYEEAAELGTKSPLRAEAQRIAAAHSDPMDRVNAALELVQQQVRYVYVGLNGGNMTPETADETWARRYGDCKGKTVLLMALLKELGIPAQAVVVNNEGGDDGLDQRLASPLLFDHVLVRANVAGVDYWLDGTLPEVVGALRQPLLPYRFALPLTATGSDLEPVSKPMLELPTEMELVEIDARAGFDRPAVWKHTSVIRGAKAVIQHMQLSPLGKAQRETAFREALLADGWDDVTSVNYRFDRETLASVLEIEGLLDADWEKSDNYTSLALPGGGFFPPAKLERPSNQDASLPYSTEPSYVCNVTTVRLPDDTKLGDWSYNDVFDTTLYARNYYRMMERRDDRTIRMVRSSRSDVSEIGADLAAADNARQPDFDNSKALIYHDEGSSLVKLKNQSAVPAYGEIDWTGANPPCFGDK